MHSARLLLLAIIASGLLLPLNSLGKENLNAEVAPESNPLHSNPLRASSLPLQASQNETIVIRNNTDFARVAEQNDWPGDGTSANPYRIEGLTITLEGQFMAVYSSTVHFVIHNCEFSATETIKVVTLFMTQNARIEHCTFRAPAGRSTFRAAIGVTSSGNNSIVNNKMVGSRVQILNSESVTISNNSFESFGVPTNEYKNAYSALHIEDSQQLVVSGNNFTGNGVGISMQRGNDSIFRQNVLFNNIRGGMVFGDCEANVITHNVLFNNIRGGMVLGNCRTNLIEDNSFYSGGLIFGGSALENYLQNCENNSYNNRSLVYLRDTNNFTLLSPGQVILVNCKDIAVENEEFDSAPAILAFSQRVTIANSSSVGGPYGVFTINSSQISLLASHIRNSSDYGVKIYASTNVTLRECRITNNEGGIRLVSDSDVAIRDTIIAENRDRGIAIDYSDDITIKNATIAENGNKGIDIAYSDNITIGNSSISESKMGIVMGGVSTNNTISNCSLYSNSLGILLDYNSSSNEVLWSDFAGTPDEEREIGELSLYTSQVRDDGINNTIDSNCWWDWLGPDNNDDGVVDLPYALNGTAGNQDRHPQAQFIGYLPPVFWIIPTDTFYELNETGHSLDWVVLGSAPSNFTITRNDDIIEEGSWESGSPIQISLDGLSEGIYLFTLTAEDEKHNTNQQSVRVQVVYYTWNFSIGDRLTWTYTTSRYLNEPYNMSMEINIPVGNQTTIGDVTVQENDSIYYVITSFKIINVEGHHLPIAFGDLTVNDVTGINHYLTATYWKEDWSFPPDQLVLPTNINWTAFAEILRFGKELVILKDTEDLFEFKVLYLEKPSMTEKHGFIYRYDKRRGILLHREYWNEQTRIELDFNETPDLGSAESAANPFDSLPVLLPLLILILGLGLSLGLGLISSEILVLHRGVQMQLRQLQHWNQEVEKKRFQLIEQSTLVELEVVASEVEPVHLRNETAYYELLDRWNSTWLPLALRPKVQALRALHESVSQSFRRFEETLEQCKLTLMDSAEELQEEKDGIQP